MEKSDARLWWYKIFVTDGFLLYIWILSFIFDQQELTCLFLLSIFTSIPPFLSFFFQLKKIINWENKSVWYILAPGWFVKGLSVKQQSGETEQGPAPESGRVLALCPWLSFLWLKCHLVTGQIMLRKYVFSNSCCSKYEGWEMTPNLQRLAKDVAYFKAL